MLSTRIERYSGHQYILEAMRETGYQPDPNGSCAGIAQMGLQAFLADALDSYNARIIHIHDTWAQLHAFKNSFFRLQPYGNPASDPRYHSLLAKLKQHESLAFFDGVALYQSPGQHQDILGRHVSQYKPQVISTIARSQAIEEQGGLYQPAHFLSFLSIEELTLFFGRLAQAAGDEKLATSISFNNHRTSVCYDGKNKKWILIDANQLPAHEVAFKDLAERVFSAHTFNNHQQDSAPISVRLYSTGNTLNTTQEILKRLENDIHFQKLLEITPAKARQKTTGRQSLLHLAAKYGNEDAALSLAHSLDTNASEQSSDTPLCIAAHHGHDKVVVNLLKNKATLVDLTNGEGKSPLYIAAENGDPKIVALLLRHQADPLLRSKDQYNAVTIAAKQGHLHVLKIFSDHDVNLFHKDGHGKTAVDYASEQRRRDILDFLHKIRGRTRREESSTQSAALRKQSLFSGASTAERPHSSAVQPARKKARFDY